MRFLKALGIAAVALLLALPARAQMTPFGDWLNFQLGSGGGGGGVASVSCISGLTQTGTASNPICSLTSPVISSFGGSGISAPTAHTITIAEGSSPFTLLTCAANLPLVGNGASADPACQLLDLTAGVKNQLPPANGGTGCNSPTKVGSLPAGANGDICVVTDSVNPCVDGTAVVGTGSTGQICAVMYDSNIPGWKMVGTVNGATSPLTIQLTNEAVTGTTLNKLARVIGAPSTAQVTPTTDTNTAIGIVVGGAGTTGTATIQVEGIISCVFDGATTANDAITISASTAGDCHDTGSANPPPNPQQALGYVLSTHAGAGTYAVLFTNTGILSAQTAPTSFLLANSNPGTTVNKLVKFTGAPSKGTVVATTDLNTAIGICTANCGNSGTATIQYDGSTTCVFDGATTAGDQITMSSTTAGDCHDTGSTVPPAVSQPIGVVLSSNGGAGTYPIYFSTINSNLSSGNALASILVPIRTTVTGATQALSLCTSVNQFLTLQHNVTLSFSCAPPDGYVVRWKLTQDVTGSRTVTWPSSVKWAGGSAPTLTTSGGQADWCYGTYDATTTNYSGAACNLNSTP